MRERAREKENKRGETERDRVKRFLKFYAAGFYVSPLSDRAVLLLPSDIPSHPLLSLHGANQLVSLTAIQYVEHSVVIITLTLLLLLLLLWGNFSV